MSTKATTLNTYLWQQQRRAKHPIEISMLLTQMGFVAKVLSREISRAALVGKLGLVGEKNATGDAQKKLDVYSNEVVLDAFSETGLVAAIASEDQRFPMHNGFDIEAIKAVLEDAKRGKGLRGASTITQQVAKNLFLWPGRSFIRKGVEVWLTFLIELVWNKQRILEMYLNIAQFSDRTFGVEAASQQFFQVSARDLTAEEAALLAAVLPGPELYDLHNPSWQIIDSQNWILVQMIQLGGEAYLQQI